jgi:hypothetical protein
MSNRKVRIALIARGPHGLGTPLDNALPRRR